MGLSSLVMALRSSQSATVPDGKARRAANITRIKRRRPLSYTPFSLFVRCAVRRVDDEAHEMHAESAIEECVNIEARLSLAHFNSQTGWRAGSSASMPWYHDDLDPV